MVLLYIYVYIYHIYHTNMITTCILEIVNLVELTFSTLKEIISLCKSYIHSMYMCTHK